MYRKLLLGMYVTVAFLSLPSNVIAKSAPAQGAAPTVNATEDGSNFLFKPNQVTVQVGQSVTFKNTGQVPHTATADDQSWDSGNLDPGASFTTPKFTKAGTITFKCTYHALQGMTGTIAVQGGPGGAAPAPAGPASPSPSASASASASAGGEAAGLPSPSPTPTAPPSEKYFPKIAGALLALVVLGVALGYMKTARKLADKG